MAGVRGSGWVTGHLQTLTLFLSPCLLLFLPSIHLFSMERKIQEGQWPVSAPTIIPTEEMHTEQGAKGAPGDEFMLSPPFTLLLPTIPSLCLPPLI